MLDIRFYDNGDKKISLFLTMELLIPAVKFCIVQSIPGLSAFNSIANIIISAILFCFILNAIKPILKRSGTFSILVFFLLILFLSVEILIYPENRDNIISSIFGIFGVSFICFIASYSLNDCKILYNYLTVASYIIISFGFFMFIATTIWGVVGTAETQTNMSLSYYILIPIMLMLHIWISNSGKKGFIAFVFVCIGMLVMIGMGSRGPLLAIALFFLLDSLKLIKNNWHAIIKFFTVMLISIFSFIFMNKLLEVGIKLFDLVGINSRTLRAVLIGNIAGLSNRDVFAGVSIDMIKEHPLLGVGFLGYLSSHNIFLETWLFYGIIIGSLFLIVYVFLQIKTLFLGRFGLNEESLTVVWLFFSYETIDSFLNLTVWGKDMFWIYLGLIFSILLKRKKDLRRSELNIGTSITHWQ